MAERLPRFYYFARTMLTKVVFPATRIKVTVTGAEHVPPDGALIVVGNHLTLLEPPMIAAVLPRDLTFMAKSELFEGNPIKTWAVRNYGAFPVRRGEGDVNAIRQALKVLKEGGALFIAPEGTRSPNGQLAEPREGVALIAQRSGAPILPLGISGVEKVSERLARWQPTEVKLSIGRPFRLLSPTRKVDHVTLHAMAEAIMERIGAELPPEYRGRFAALSDRQQFVEEL